MAKSTRKLTRFRCWGIRALNWAPMDRNEISHFNHLESSNAALWVETGPLTVLIGPNGGGKTTLLAALSGLADPSIWPSLPREQQSQKRFSGMDFEGDGWSLDVRFEDHDFDNRYGWLIKLHSRDGDQVTGCTVVAPRFAANDNDTTWQEQILTAVRATRCPDVFIWDSGQHGQSEELLVDLPKILNSCWRELAGVSPFQLSEGTTFPAFQWIDEKHQRLRVFLADDVCRPSAVSIGQLPHGWVQLAAIIQFVSNAAEGSLVLLDEPDRSLHPHLQRVMLDSVMAIATEKQLQIVLCTQSPTLINPTLLSRHHGKAYQVTQSRCTAITDRRHVLDEMGFRSSDIAHANGVIWVEGPTDRLYIMKWLSLYSKAMGKQEWSEGSDYVIAFYGGALLKHITLLDDPVGARPSKVPLRALNQHCAVVIDSDTVTLDAEIAPEKRRVVAEAEKTGQDVWVTQGYTIEDYLPTAYDRFLEKQNGKTIVKGSKMNLAESFFRAESSWEASYLPSSNLSECIEMMHDMLSSWQTGQSVHKNYRGVK